MKTQTHIVFGATGALGAAIIRRLSAEKITTKAFVRDTTRARKILPEGVELIQGDAMDSQQVKKACTGVDIVYNCVNVPYPKWSDVLPIVTDNILAGTREAKAHLVFPGNVYGYGPFQKTPATEEHPLAATAKKGQLRNKIEKKMMKAHQAGDIKVVIPRFPDYYGPNVTNKFMGSIFEAVLAGKKASWFGKLDVPHNITYIEDAADACVLLATTESAYGQAWHVTGEALTGQQFIEMAFKAAGTNKKIGVLRRGMMKFAGLFNPEAREMIEMLYEFEEPLILDSSKFAQSFPSFKYTSHNEAVAQTVKWFKEH